jgi:putative ABC transport system substrate-binding protein
MNVVISVLYLNVLLLSSFMGCSLYRLNHPILTQDDATKTIVTVNVLIYRQSSITNTILEGFIKKFESFGNYRVKTVIYNANGNYLTLKAMAQEVFAQKSDLIWGMGSQAVEAIASITLKSKSKTATMLTNVSWETLSVLNEANPELKEYAFGWGGSYDWPMRIALIKKIIPRAQTILFLHRDTKLNNKWIIEMHETFNQHKLKIVDLNLTDEAFSLNFIHEAMGSIDLILVVLDHAIINMIDSIIAIANNYNVPLCVSDLESTKKGAFLGICPDILNNGEYSALIAKKIIIDNHTASATPFVELKDWSIKVGINLDAIKKQQPGTDPNIFFLIEHGFIKESSEHESIKSTEMIYV